MKEANRPLFLALAVILLAGVFAGMRAKRQSSRPAAPGAVKAGADSSAPAGEGVAILPTATTQLWVRPMPGGLAGNSPPLEPVPVRSPTNVLPSNASPAVSRGKEPRQDPLARVALGLVGADGWAEAYWYEAINDPDLPAQERQDLIEDLNEDGLSDPHHPTTEDLPLILSRLQILEEVGWDPMDQVNADAFEEAYKDLVKLANLAWGGDPAGR
jgi:hypothetical protein